MNLFLIGYRGTGKTTVAQIVGRRLDYACVDTDREIERRAAKSIAAIFADEGEPAFRDWESAVLKDLASRERHVFSLGGGAVMRAENRELLARGRTAWLQASAETIYARISADATTAAQRPNLTSEGGLAEIRELLDQREPVYRQCADLIVDTEGKSPDAVADEMIQSLEPNTFE